MNLSTHYQTLFKIKIYIGYRIHITEYSSYNNNNNDNYDNNNNNHNNIINTVIIIIKIIIILIFIIIKYQFIPSKKRTPTTKLQFI